MADRNWRNRNGRREGYRGGADHDFRQQEQFGPGGWDHDDERPYGQMGEGSYRSEDRQADPGYPIGWDHSERAGHDGRGYARRDPSAGAPGRYDYGPSRYEGPGRGFESFTGNDIGGRDFVAPTSGTAYGWRPYGTPAGHGYPGGATRGCYREEDERGFFDRAADEVASWFGDEDAARRREMDHTGRGPQNYIRSDERILEDVCDNLTEDWSVDARNVQVTVKDREVTLDGTVTSRQQKRRAEDCAEEVSGVTHVQNNLRVEHGRESDEGEALRGRGEKTTGALA